MADRDNSPLDMAKNVTHKFVANMGGRRVAKLTLDQSGVLSDYVPFGPDVSIKILGVSETVEIKDLGGRYVTDVVRILARGNNPVAKYDGELYYYMGDSAGEYFFANVGEDSTKYMTVAFDGVTISENAPSGVTVYDLEESDLPSSGSMVWNAVSAAGFENCVIRLNSVVPPKSSMKRIFRYVSYNNASPPPIASYRWENETGVWTISVRQSGASLSKDSQPTGSKVYPWDGVSETVSWYDEARANSSTPTFMYVPNQVGSTMFRLVAVERYDLKFQAQGESSITTATVAYNGAVTTKTTPYGSGSSDDGKVSVADGTVSGYLSEVLKSDTDTVELGVVGNELRIGLNLSGESDPKLKTIDESLINANTANYGSYYGGGTCSWGDTSTNVIAYRGIRVSDAQGSLTRVRFALTGTFGSGNPGFRVGIFSLDGTLLGSSDTMIFDGSKFVGEEHGDVLSVPSNRLTDGDIPLHEETAGALSIKRNTRYAIQLVWFGMQFAAKEESGNGITSNYNYDYELGNNVQTTYAGFKWWDGSDGKQQAQHVPYLSFGAADIGG